MSAKVVVTLLLCASSAVLISKRTTVPEKICVVCVLAGVLAFLGTGCAALTTNGIVTPDRISAVTRLAAYLGCTMDVSAHPERRPLWQRVDTGLATAIAGDKITVTSLQQALSAVGVTDWGNGDGQLYLGAGATFVDAITGVSVPVTDDTNVGAAAHGIADGIHAALLAMPPSLAGTRNRVTPPAAPTEFTQAVIASRNPGYTYRR